MFDRERLHYEFRVRDPSKRDYEKTSQKLYDILTGVDDNFTLSFDDPWSTTNVKISADPKVSGRSDSFGWYGITWLDEAQLLNVTLSIWQWKSLLRNDLTASERMATQFVCACTLIHELAVSKIDLLKPADQPVS